MFENIRKKIFLFIEPSKYTGFVTPYNLFMTGIVFVSVLPIMVKRDTPFLIMIDNICTVIYIIDYFLRWLTADIKFKQPGAKSFFRYPFQRMAVIDLLSIIPGFFYINGTGVCVLFRILRVFRFLRIIRYSKSTSLIIKALRNQKASLLAVVLLSLEYVMLCALVIFTVEPQTFKSFFDAVYWSTVSLTTVGYGDIYPVTPLGQVMAMISSFFGIAVIAMPAGLITAGIIQEMEKEYSKEDKKKHADKETASSAAVKKKMKIKKKTAASSPKKNTSVKDAPAKSSSEKKKPEKSNPEKSNPGKNNPGNDSSVKDCSEESPSAKKSPDSEKEKS